MDDYSKENGFLKVKTEGTDGKKKMSRDKWTGRLDFVMTALSFAVGMGNIWRFPYLCYKNGGGAFLIPYVVMVLVAGIPMMFLEFSFGQYGSLGIVSIWKAVPLLQACGSVLEERNCTLHNGTWYNNTCYGTFIGLSDQLQQLILNKSVNNVTDQEVIKHKSPADEYFHHFMLDISDGLHSLGAPRWQILLVYLFCWILIAICLSKGVKSFGKITYVTTLFPYVILTVLLVRVLLLDGAVDGILYYITPDFKKLLTATVWADAAVQVFFSLSVCWGGLITLASYNDFNNNCLRDAFVVGIGDALTSIFGGVVIFAVIGYMSHELLVPIDEVATQGAGLAFIIYPSAVTSLPVSPLWSILFMLVLISLGLGTQFTIVATSHTTLLDVFPDTLRKGHRPLILLLVICTVCFILGLPLTTQGGMYVLQLMDTYCASYTLLIVAVVELIALAWVYGYERLADNIEEMTGSKPSKFWMICWKFVTPSVITSVMVFTLVRFTSSSYGDFQYPLWSDIMGWLVVCLEISFIPGVAIYKVCTADRELSFKQKIRFLCKPAPGWGPADKKLTSELSMPLNSEKQNFDNQITEKYNDPLSNS
ncbi:hypothetical protein LSH36_9g04017 [Paralvinella palmiformis]|uniref:Transporter n=1 Tax=Paralvinella palmiformis TaxID=53620 RepID=A0AAD9KDX5_9ANNE|nr:hypothetical protein LSH36_9g04017 [Paralvinella palmiformis]